MREEDPLQAIEAEAVACMRYVRRVADALRFRVEADEDALPGLMVLRFPARGKAALLASCWHLGHDCVIGQQYEGRETPDRRARKAVGATLLGAAHLSLAAQGFQGRQVWLCQCRGFAPVARMLGELMPSRAERKHRRIFTAHPFSMYARARNTRVGQRNHSGC